MRLIATRILGVLLFLCCASAVQARQWPTGPNGNVTDSLTVLQIQDTLIVFPGGGPGPAVPDTVRGVRGIVTGFDPIPTGFGFYIQNNGRDALGNVAGWRGIDVFTGSTNKQCIGIDIGDSVAVYGKMQDFGGGTEIEGLDLVQATDDLFVRIIQKGASIPPYHIGTVAELKEIPFAAPFGSDTTREKWEGSLVQVNGPLRVVRRTPTVGSGGLGTNNSFLVVDDVVCPAASPGPCDSMFIDGNTLFVLNPPTNGTIVNAVRGIYEQRGRGYRIQLTSGDDLNDPSPVGIVDAFPVEDNIVRVKFDRSVSNGTDLSKYSLASAGTIVSAAAVDGRTYDITVNSGLVDGDPETITANGLIRASNGAVMTTPGSRDFINGVMPISLLQAPSADSLSSSATWPCKDVSQFVGNNQSTVRISFRGVVTGNVAALYLMQDASMGPRTGVSVFAPSCPLVRNRKYLIAGSIQEFPVVTTNASETEVVGTVYVKDEGLYGALYPDIQTVAVLSDTACDASQSTLTGEDFEEGLVKLAYVKVVNERGAGQTFRVAGPNPTFTDTMSIDSTGTWNFNADSLHIMSITGHQRLIGGRWRVAPRNNADIQDHGLNVGVPGDNPAQLTFSTFPNPARTPKFAFALPYESEVELSVYDLAGRQVALIAKGRFAAGPHAREWNGLTKAGNAAEAGVYFYRLKVGGETRNLRGVFLQ